MHFFKNFFIAFLFTFIASFTTVAYAEEVDDPYFFRDHEPHTLLQQAMPYVDEIVNLRDDIYSRIISGNYHYAAFYCELTESAEKIVFGKNYLDENLTELTAKLYLMADEPDEAEKKIKSLLANASDNLVKVRALNLQSDLLNRRANYGEALKITEEAEKLLKSNFDEKLSLINQARIAKAYCGLNEPQKSLAIAENLFPQMQVAFGNAGIETLSLMSTLAEDYLKTKRYEDSRKILDDKLQLINNHYKKNSVISSKSFLEFTEFYFITGDKQRGEERLNTILETTEQISPDSSLQAYQIYQALNKTAVKYLDANNPVVLKSELGLIKISSLIGDIPQSIERCKKICPN